MNMQRSPFAQKISTFIDLSEQELEVLSNLHGRRRTYSAGTDMVFQGQKDQPAYVLAEGWACSYCILPGGGRQIVDFHIPGDFLGLRSVLLRTAGSCVEPVTTVKATRIGASEVGEIFATHRRLGTAALWAASRDYAMVVEHLVGLGRRSAVERTAHLLLELGERLSLVGLATKEGYDCPLSQYLLADALGLSAVHVNRVLRELREEKLVTFRNGRVELTDFEGLAALAEFDHSYLDHGAPAKEAA